MALKTHLIKERFDLLITAEDGTFRGEFDLDKNARYLIGIQVTSDRDDLLYYRGSQRMQFNDVELFPLGFESKLLMAGINVSPNDRMVSLGKLPTGNGKLVVSYTDSSNPVFTFEPYRLTLYTFSTIADEPDSAND